MEQRKMLFKAKRLDNGEWCVGDLVHRRGKAYIYRTFEDMSGAILESIDPSTVCQFTGLKDMNGVEIWEGDYLKPINWQGKPMKVVFKNGTFGLDIPYRGLKILPLTCCDIRNGNILVDFKLGDRKEGEK